MIRQTFFKAALTSSDEETDVVVIGSGIGGLSGAALLARYGFDVTVCERHSIPGGATHAFECKGFNPSELKYLDEAAFPGFVKCPCPPYLLHFVPRSCGRGNLAGLVV